MESTSKLKWRCRRGTKELDYLLENYLNTYFQQADKKEQALFVELLGMQDSQLIRLLLGSLQPESSGLVRLVKKIRTTPDI